MLYWPKIFLEVIILPPNSLVIGAVVGLLLRRRLRILGNFIVGISALLWFVLSMPAVSDKFAQKKIEYPPLKVEALDSETRAIVVLTGGLYRKAPEFGGQDTVSFESLSRARYGAVLHRRTGLPLLVVGKGPQSTTAEADVVTSVLTKEFQVPVRWNVPEGRDTIESADAARAILEKINVQSIVLVTNISHMKRASVAFKKAGFKVNPAPVNFYFYEKSRYAFVDFLPWCGALYRSNQMIKERLGAIWNRL